MKKLLQILLLLAGFSLQNNAQEIFDQFGKIPQEQIDITTCSYDPTADAVVLSDIGKSSFTRTDEGFDLLFERITRIKILNDAGKKYSEIAIPFYYQGDIQESVEIHKASTYTITNGKISKITNLDLKSCYTENLSENWRDRKFAMPDVQPGSIIEYSYSIQSPYKFNLHDWEFQWDIPVLYSAYEVRMIPFYSYVWLIQGRQSLDEYKSYEDREQIDQHYGSATYHDVVYKFGLKNLPAFNDEAFIPSRSDYIIKIDFQLANINPLSGGQITIMTTWPELIKEYTKHDDIGKYAKKSEKSSDDILNPDSLLGKTETQKFNFIVNFAKDNFKWNHENSQYASQSPSDFQKKKIGNCADINLWLVGALRKAGLKADPLVLSTRKHGRILIDYPFSSDFNAVVAYTNVGNQNVLADATDPFCPNNKISIQYMNDKGLLLRNSDSLVWLSLQSPAISTKNTAIKIDSIGLKQCAQVVLTSTDYEALKFRNNYANHRADLLKDLKEKNYQIIDSSLIIKYETDRTHPFAYMYNLSRKSEIINGKIYIQPFLNEVLSENPLKQKVRTYPVDLTYPVTRTYTSEIKIPDGYMIQYLPEKVTISDELFDLNYTAAQNDSGINVVFVYTLKHSVYSADQYSRIKGAFDQIVKKGSEKIVLVRK